jgi:hypothetical protein
VGTFRVPATFENITGGGGKYPWHLYVESFVFANSQSPTANRHVFTFNV